MRYPAIVLLLPILLFATPLHAIKEGIVVDPNNNKTPAATDSLPPIRNSAVVVSPPQQDGQVFTACANPNDSPPLCGAPASSELSEGSDDSRTIGGVTTALPTVTKPVTGITDEAKRQAVSATDEVRRALDGAKTILTQPKSAAVLSGVAVGKTATTFAPAATPTAARDREQLANLADAGGDPAAAREFALQALQRSPDDPALQSFVRLTEPEQTAHVDGKTVKKRIDELAAGMRQDEGTGGGALLASPISFGALIGAGAAGGARQPAMYGGLGGAKIDPAGLTTPDLHGTAQLREASGKIAIKDFNGAETVLTRRIQEAPNDGGAYRLRALTRRYLNRIGDSAQDAQRAVDIEPRDSRALYLLSRDETDLGRPKDGLAEADRALAVDSKDANAYVARSVANGAMGRTEEELADLARAASLDSQFDALYRETLDARGGAAPGSRAGHSWPVWFGAIGTALLFFSFALFRKRGDSSVRMALRKDDHDAFAAAAPVVSSVPKGFRVVKTLGQGGMGVVYEAVDLGLQRTVALKKLRAEIADNPRERGRFLKEARTVAALHHPNIVEIHAIHEDAEGLFIVFERVPGESLHERLGRGPMSNADAAAFLKQIASALDYAHGQGVVHQDLKPGNVMIHAGLAKVMDFGIARRVQETLSTMSKIEVSGTPAYMSPEQEQGVVTPSADVFALGACAYETLTGAMPFPTGGLMMKAQKMYRKPSETRPGLSPAVDAAIGRALEPRPEDRWPSASSFVDALARALS